MTTNTSSKWAIDLTKGKASNLSDPIGLVKNFTDVLSFCDIYPWKLNRKPLLSKDLKSSEKSGKRRLNLLLLLHSNKSWWLSLSFTSLEVVSISSQSLPLFLSLCNQLRDFWILIKVKSQMRYNIHNFLSSFQAIRRTWSCFTPV